MFLDFLSEFIILSKSVTNFKKTSGDPPKPPEPKPLPELLPTADPFYSNGKTSFRSVMQLFDTFGMWQG